MNREIKDLLVGRPATKPRWQFSVLSLLTLTTAVAINLGLFRIHPLFSIAIFVLLGEVAVLTVADHFVRHASRREWTAVTKVAWIAVGVFLTLVLAIFIFAIWSLA